VRLIATALIEREGNLLLVQLAKGSLAGFWLLPSATVEDGSVEQTAQTMILERTGHPVRAMELLSVLEESRPDVLLLRFLFRAEVGAREAAIADPEIVQARWFSRTAVLEVLEERDVVPNLGVMSVLRAWADGVIPRPLEPILHDALCPCGSGDRYRSCCGWEDE
jgi:ADP-ribose pyrophosphatase YjhB (NUDIX family)